MMTPEPTSEVDDVEPDVFVVPVSGAPAVVDVDPLVEVELLVDAVAVDVPAVAPADPVDDSPVDVEVVELVDDESVDVPVVSAPANP